MFRAIAFCPMDQIEDYFLAIISSDLYKQPYSLDPKKYKKLKEGQYETEATYRQKLNYFASYMRVSKDSYTYLILCYSKH